jgi:hypothetical protein
MLFLFNSETNFMKLVLYLEIVASFISFIKCFYPTVYLLGFYLRR